MAEKYEGYIKLYRTIRRHWLWEDKPFSKGQAWLDLLLLANHSDHKSVAGGVVTEYHRGQVNVSQSYLAKAWGWSRHKVKAFLTDLSADNMVTYGQVEGQGKDRATTIVNYTFWQGLLPEQGQAEGQVRDRLGTGEGQVRDTNNNNKEYINNYKNEYHSFKRPRTAEDMQRRLKAIAAGEIPKRGNL